MTETALAWLTATWALVGAALTQPLDNPAVWIVAVAAGFYTAGANPNKTIAVIGRSIMVGAIAGVLTMAVQLLFFGGLA
jgi:hypothetical protein